MDKETGISYERLGRGMIINNSPDQYLVKLMTDIPDLQPVYSVLVQPHTIVEIKHTTEYVVHHMKIRRLLSGSTSAQPSKGF